jgi:outer membrane protein TolC
MKPQNLALLLFVVLAGCATYRPEPLPTAPDLASGVSGLTGTVPADRPLDMQTIATLAVLRNPDLVASRKKSNVADAQAFAAGLLPDPQLDTSVDHPSALGFVNGYAIGLSEDLQALLTFSARADSARAAADQAKLNTLWDEWQTIEKACTLYIQKINAEQKARALGATASALVEQAEHSSNALREHSVTLDQAGADLAAALDIASQRDAAERDALTADSGLKALLALRPDATLALADLGDPTIYTDQELAAALDGTTRSRPDLLALEAGYRAQEEAVRVAILQQFPTMTLGVNRQADTSNVHTTGLSLTVNLPIFNGARGEIRVQRATREQLRAEYQARLDQTTSDALRLYREISLLHRQVRELEARTPEFRQMGATARKAYANRDLAPATYVVLLTTETARENELSDLKASLWIDVIALHTLLGSPFIAAPAVGPPK